MTELFSVKGRVAVVTGGLGQLGTQFSKSLAEAGAKVAIFSRRSFSREQIAEKFPGLEDRIRVYVASVTDKVALQQATEQLIADWGVPHILVNNAGIDSKPSGSADQNSPFEIYPQEYWNEIIDTNLTGNGLRSVRIVSGQHERFNTQTMQLTYRLAAAFLHRISHRKQP